MILTFLREPYSKIIHLYIKVQSLSMHIVNKQCTKTLTKNIWYTYQCAYCCSGHPNSRNSGTFISAGHAPCKCKSNVIYVLRSSCPPLLKYNNLLATKVKINMQKSKDKKRCNRDRFVRVSVMHQKL